MMAAKYDPFTGRRGSAELYGSDDSEQIEYIDGMLPVVATREPTLLIGPRRGRFSLLVRPIPCSFVEVGITQDA